MHAEIDFWDSLDFGWVRPALKIYSMVFASFAGLVLLLGIAWFVLDWHSRVGTYKMVMPGTYKIRLESRSYTAIVFSKWRSKNIDLPKNAPISLAVSSVNGQSVPMDVMGTQLIDEISSVNVGGPWGLFDVHRPGEYQISSKDKFVVMVIPREDLTFGLGSSWECPGMDDDFGFEWR